LNRLNEEAEVLKKFAKNLRNNRSESDEDLKERFEELKK
jgi:hypothetical protein